jgi:hypothetical protein
MSTDIDPDLLREIENEVTAREPLEENMWFRPTKAMKKQVKAYAKHAGVKEAQVLRAVMRLGLRRQAAATPVQ